MDRETQHRIIELERERDEKALEEERDHARTEVQDVRAELAQEQRTNGVLHGNLNTLAARLHDERDQQDERTSVLRTAVKAARARAQVAEREVEHLSEVYTSLVDKLQHDLAVEAACHRATLKAVERVQPMPRTHVWPIVDTTTT